MSVADYVVEETPEGRMLVVTGVWSDAAGEALLGGAADGLVLNYALGFVESSLEMLDERWPLRRLDVLDRSIVDLEPLERLGSLVSLSVEAAPDARLDLAALPGLRSVAGDWSLIGSTLSAVPGLERMVTSQFDERDLRAFRDHLGLHHLTVKDAPALESLDGVERLSDLRVLEVRGAPRLREIDAVAAVGGSLERFWLEAARPGVIDAVESLTRLRFLGVSRCDQIASLRPVEALQCLETFHAWGSTRIMDGDLSPLARLPRLKEIRMQQRRGYTPPLADLRASLAARSASG